MVVANVPTSGPHDARPTPSPWQHPQSSPNQSTVALLLDSTFILLLIQEPAAGLHLLGRCLTQQGLDLLENYVNRTSDSIVQLSKYEHVRLPAYGRCL